MKRNDMEKMEKSISRGKFIQLSGSTVGAAVLSNLSWAFASDKKMDVSDDTLKKIDGLIAQMTLEEKCLQMSSQFPNANIRLKIPNLVTGECCHGIMFENATMFPQAIALGGTWDEELIERVATAIAKECKILGFHQCYTPMIGVLRDPRWGRTEEGYSEDSYLVTRIGVAFINGLQGKGKERYDENHIMATAKHYVADGEPQMGANGGAMDISDYILHNVHLPPFKAAVQEAKVGSVMPAHHLVNGVPCHASKYLIDTVLRKEYGFTGYVVSDNADIERMHSFLHFAEDHAHAVKLALEAGVDAELVIRANWKQNKLYGPTLIKELQTARIPMKLVDTAVKRVLAAKFELGLFEDPSLVDIKYDLLARGYDEDKLDVKKSKDIENQIKFILYNKPKEGYEKVLNNPQHQQLALEAALKSIILLKNEQNLLPLNTSVYKTIAVIGPNADVVLLGGYSVENKYCTTLLKGIKDYVGNSATVMYNQGCDLTDKNKETIGEAVALANKADVVILALGQDKIIARENRDRDDLTLTGRQPELAEALYKTGKPIVLVLQHAQPLAIPWLAEKITAIVDGWYNGQAAGTAFAKVIFGEYNPGGKLQMTYPRNVGQVPCYYNQLRLGRPRSLFDSDPKPLFAFGYGLSFTTFRISAPKLEKSTINKTASTKVTVTVENTGKVKGEEVVQLYIADVFAQPSRPIKELKGFKRIQLNQGEIKEVSFEIGKAQLEFWSNGKWVIQEGAFEIMVGNSSDNYQMTMLTVV